MSRNAWIEDDAEQHRGGGVAIIYRKTFKSKEIRHMRFDTFEVVTILLHCGSTDVVVSSLYRPSSAAVTQRFYEEFADFLESFAFYNCPVIVLGDFNIHCEDESNYFTKRFITVLNEYDYVQLTVGRTIGHGGTIDLIITQSTSSVLFDYVTDFGSSDHCVVFGHVSTDSGSSCSGRDGWLEVAVRDWRRFSFQSFSSSLRESGLCSGSFGWTGGASADELYSEYVDALTGMLDVAAPVRVVRRRCSRGAGWFDADCRRERRVVRGFERRWRKNPTEAGMSLYLAARRTLHRFYDMKIKAYWTRRLDDAGASARQRWNTINDILCRRHVKRIPDSITPDRLSDFFDDKVGVIRNMCLSAGDPCFSDPTSQVFEHFEAVTVQEVISAVNRMSTKHCCLDPLPTWLLKRVIGELAPYITVIMNKSLSTGIVPALMKTAIISPRLKKIGLEAADMASYRPVSNLPFLSKVLEKLVSDQISTHWNKIDAFGRCQSAYRSHHSTETALLKISTDVLGGLDDGNVVLMCMLDLSAAFDTVDHEILLKRLNYTCGVKKDALLWFRSYLENRTARVRVGEKLSECSEMKSGVPQGSVLGPQLFLLYVKDIAAIAARHGFQFHGYADDTYFYRICSATQDDVDQTARDFSACFEDIRNWYATNRLQLNPEKTECLWIHPRSKDTLNFPDILHAGGVIKPRRVSRALGVYFNERFDCGDSIGDLSRRCFYYLRQFKAVRKHVNNEAMKSILQAFVSSRLDYCNALYAGIPCYMLNKIQRIQNCAARLYSGTSKYSSVRHVMSDELHWLPVRSRIDFKLATLTYKIIHGMAPEYLSDMIALRLSLIPEGRNLRSSTRNDLAVVRHKTVRTGDRMFTYRSPKIWNNLPVDVRDAPTLDTFCRRLKTFLFALNFCC